MANLSITNDFSANTTILSAEVNTNFTDIETYINNRNGGSTSWDNVKSVAAISIAATTNQLVLGTTNTITINSVAPAASLVYSIRDVGAASDIALLIGGPGAAVTELAINNTAASGDPVLSWELSGTNQFTMGVDDSDSDTLKIGTTAVETGTMWKATAAGEITQPLQPSFLALLSADATDVTGDGTVATVSFDTEVFDQGGDFSSNTFTAPVTGKYYLSATVTVLGVLTTHTELDLQIVTSNRSYRTRFTNAVAYTRYYMQLDTLADMDANDTVTVTFTGSNGTKVIDLDGGASPNTNFSGSLIN